MIPRWPSAANEVARRYIERDHESKFEAASVRRVAQQAPGRPARAGVGKRDRPPELSLSRDALALTDRQNIVMSKLQDLNSTVTKAKTDRIIREAQYQQIQSIKNDPAALEAHPLIASNSFVQTLKAQASELARQDALLSDRPGPKHPDRVQVSSALSAVQERLTAEVSKVVSGIEADYQGHRRRKPGLTKALNSQKAEAFSLDRKGVEYAALEREAASSRQVFDALLQQTKEAVLNSDAQQSPMRIVDPAEPPGAPVRPRRDQGLAAALMLGVLGAAGGAFGREYMRRAVDSPDDLERKLGLPVLALVPPAESGEAEKAGPLSPHPTEAFRRLGANVMLACGDEKQPGNVLVVTSAAPREGKSFVSSHLAMSLAAVGSTRRAHRRRHAPAAPALDVRPPASARAGRRAAGPPQRRRGATAGGTAGSGPRAQRHPHVVGVGAPVDAGLSDVHRRTPQ